MIYWKSIGIVGFPAMEKRVLVVWEGQVYTAMLGGDLSAPDPNDTLVWLIDGNNGTMHRPTVEVEWWSEANLPR